MLRIGDKIPAATVWTAPHERRALDSLLAAGPALFLVYLFDWSTT